METISVAALRRVCKMVGQRSNKETIDSIGRRWCKALQMGFNGPCYRIGLAIRD